MELVALVKGSIRHLWYYILCALLKYDELKMFSIHAYMLSCLHFESKLAALFYYL